MAENEVVRTIRVRGVPEGLENLTSQLQRAEKAYSGVGSAAAASGSETETSARKLNTTERAYRSLTERLDSTARIYRQLQTDTRTLSGAFDAGFMGKGAEAAARFNSELLQIRQTLQDVGGRMATGSGGLDRLLNVDSVAKSAREAASVFEEDLLRLDTIAQQRAAQIGANFGRELSEQLTSSTGKSARDSAAIFEAELGRLDDIARQRAAQTGQEFQRALNERLVGGSGKSASSSASVFQEMFAEQDKQAQTLQKLRQQYDPLGVAQDRYASAIDETNKLLQAGQISETQHLTITTNARKVLEDTTKAYNGAFVAQGKYASGAGLARHELINLSRQMQDVGVSLASGQSPLTVLIQQGTQIADVFASSRASLSGFFAQAVRGVAGFAMSGAGLLTGGALVGAAAIASAYRYAESQKNVELALMGVGRASGQTVSSINRVAEAAAQSGEVSRSAARDIASIFAGTGRIDSSLITSNLVDRGTRGYGNLTGKSQKEAAQELAQALASPTAGAAELQKRLGSLSDAQMQFIRSAEASGNRTAAQKALFDAYNPTLQEAATKTSILARAWEAVAKAVSDASDKIGKAITGGDLDQRIAEMQKIIENRQKYGYRSGSIPQLQGDLDALLRERRRNNESRDFRTADAQSNDLSGRAGEALRGLFGDESRLRNLKDQQALLEKTFGDSSAMAKLGPLSGKVSEGIERLKSSIENFETENERIARDFQLQTQQIDAYTLTQKAAVEAERARVEAIRAGRGEIQAGVEAEQARTRVIIEANRQLRDAARDLKDAGSLIGLSPFQRSLQENRNASRRERETLTVNGSTSSYRNPFGGTAPTIGALNGSLSRDQVLDLIEKHESGGRNIHQNVVGPNGDYNPSTGTITGPSSAQGFFQITNPTWRDGARMAGVDLSQFPNAMSAPYETQRKVAGALYDSRGVSPWAPYNASLRGALAGQGVQGANDNNAARNANTVKEAYEGWNTPLANANRQLEANTELLNRQKETMFGTTAQVAEAAEKQRLINEYMAQGIPITASLAAGIDDYAKRFGQLSGAADQFQLVNNVLKDTQDIGASALKGFISDLRAGKSGAEAFANALNRIADKMLDTLIDGMFGKGILGNAGGSSGGLFGLLSKGFGLGGGGEQVASNGLALFGPGFATGGYTGGGGKYDVAGFVHRDEFVFSKEATQRLGAGNLDRLHRGALKGYEVGGLVTPAAAYAMPAPYIHDAPANSNAAPVTFKDNRKINITPANGVTPEQMVAALKRYDEDSQRNMVTRLKVANSRFDR